MRDGFTISADVTRAMAALDRLGPAVEQHTIIAAYTTADNIRREARARLARQLVHPTGKTAEGLLVSAGALHHAGWAVISTREHPLFSWHTMKRSGRSHTQRVTQSNVPIWLEHGTRYMLARPFFYSSARLEQGAHDRRMMEAIQKAITEAGGR